MDRLDPFEVGSEAMKALIVFGGFSYAKALEPDILALIKARTLQLTAGEYGERQCRKIVDRLPSLGPKVACLDDWYSSRAFSARERAALNWAECVIHSTSRRVPDDLYEEAARVFPPDELFSLAITVAAMCAWAQMAQTFQLSESVG